ncbi:MAG: response regulator transcription factor [Chloroflexota bacterium]
MTIRILLVDDHRLFREGLRSLIEKCSDMEVVAEAGDGRTASRMVEEMSPNVVVMDIAMPDLNGIEATRQIIAGAPEVRILALSMYSDKRFIGSMFSAGAKGYLPKESAFNELADAIRTVAVGRIYLSPSIVDVVVRDYFIRLEKEDSSVFSVLTSREREVLQLVSEGKSIRDIAQYLHLSTKTIESHRQAVMNKLGINSIAELTKYAIREGLTSLD